MRRLLVLCAVAASATLGPADSYAQERPITPARAVGPVADSLRGMAFRMVEHLRDRDTARLIALYGDTVNFVHIDEGIIVPWSQLSSMMRSYLASVSSNPIVVVGEPGVTLVDNRNAVLYVVHRFEGGPGREAHEGVWTGVLHRFPDAWRIVHSHSSDRRNQ